MNLWIGIVAAAVAGFAIGGVWYGPLFGKAWMAARGISPESAKDGANMPLIFGTTFLLNLWMAFMLTHLFGTYDAEVDPHHKLVIAAIAVLGFVIPAMGVNYLFSRVTLKLFLIDAGYWLVNFLAMGLILGLLH
jgi:hypothetical protein